MRALSLQVQQADATRLVAGVLLGTLGVALVGKAQRLYVVSNVSNLVTIIAELHQAR
jgi:hypothetical protein